MLVTVFLLCFEHVSKNIYAFLISVYSKVKFMQTLPCLKSLQELSGKHFLQTYDYLQMLAEICTVIVSELFLSVCS